jgi:hypothetical protein
MNRVMVVAALLTLAGCAPNSQPAVHKAAAWLWKQQESDGGWHSHTYGLLRSGQSLTPFVLDALLDVPEEVYPLPAEKVDRAVAFIHTHIQSDGSLGTSDRDIPDYPNYSTALAVTALCRARRSGWEQQIAPMIGYLRTQQFTEQNGWHPPDPVYGAWGMGGERRRPLGTGHVDLSMTRYVLEALRGTGAADSDPAFAAARVFVERCQNRDGGFFFSTTEFDTNKAGHDGTNFRSYGSTTADGILALIAIGRPTNDDRVAAALRWLSAHHHDMAVPGFVGDAYQRWPQGLAFYYSAASTRAFRVLRVDAGSGVEQGLRRGQRRDGSWANVENLVKEDDPLIATAFAIRALR